MAGLRASGLWASLLLVFAHATSAQGVAVEGYPTREHGRALKAQLEHHLQAPGAGGAHAGAGLFLVEDDAEFLYHLLAGTTIEGNAKEYWDSEVDLLCGIRGEDQVLVSLDDGSGTPTDYTRQVMIASGMDDPMPVYIGLDLVQSLLIHTLATQAGHNITAVQHGSDIHSDGRLLSHLRLQASGMAFVDERHSGAPGFAVALTLQENDDPDIPSVLDFDIESIPPRFAYVYASRGSDAAALPVAEQACRDAGDRYLDAAAVRDAMAKLTALHERAVKGGSND